MKLEKKDGGFSLTNKDEDFDEEIEKRLNRTRFGLKFRTIDHESLNDLKDFFSGEKNVDRETHGYCFIKGLITPQNMLSALHNIPYQILPPTLKKVEDLLTYLGITPIFSRPPELYKITEDLKKSAESMEKLSEKNNTEWLFSGTIPYIKPYSKCDYGQTSIDMIKDIDLRQLYLGLEDGMYSFKRTLKDLKDILSDEGKDLLKVKHRDDHDDISILASDLYRERDEVYHTDREDEIKKELDIIKESLGWEARNEEWELVKDEIDDLKDEAITNFKNDIHSYWIEHWYDEYAWDFDEKERESLKNPYK